MLVSGIVSGLSGVWELLEFLNVSEFGIANAGLKLLSIVVILYGIGWLVRKRWFRSLVLVLFSKIPIISDLVDFFFNHDYIERISKGEFPVVMYQHPGIGIRAFGLVTDRGDTWCTVFFPTSPFPLSGYTLDVRTDQLQSTDLKPQDLFKMMLSFGLSCPSKK